MKSKTKNLKLAALFGIVFVTAASLGMANVIASADGVIDTEAELSAALAAGGEVTVGGNVELTAEIEIPTGVTATLDLNGKEITVAYQEGSTEKHIYALNNYGTLTIEDGVGTGSITARGIYNQDGATLTVNEAKIVAQDYNGGACVWGYGSTSKVYLNNATLIGYTGCVSSEGYLEINGGTYTCYSGIIDDGTLMTSPTYNIRAYNGLKITDGTFTSRHGVISLGGGEAVIENGSYTIEFTGATTSNVVYVYGGANLTINGGSFISDNTSGKADSGAAVLVSGSTTGLRINDGEYVGMNGMVSGNDNTVISGGSYETVWDYNHYGNIETFVETGAVITVAGETIVKNEDGTTTALQAKIGSESYATFQEAIEAAQNGDTIKLLSDIEIEGDWGSCNLPANITINGNNKTLKLGTLVHYGANAAFYSSGSYTVKNLTIDCESCGAGAQAFNMSNGGVLENVTVGSGFNTGVYAGGTVEIKDCVFNNSANSNPWGIYSEASSLDITVIGSTFNSQRAALLPAVTEGEFTDNIVNSDKGVSLVSANVTIENNTFNGDRAFEIYAEATISNNKFGAGTCIELETNADLSGNYWGGGEPNVIEAEGKKATITSYYTEVNVDGSINTDSQVLYYTMSKVGVIRNIATQNEAGEARYQMVFLCAIDSLEYKKVGFEITVAGKTAVLETQTVYRGYTAADTDYTPNDFGESCNYIFAIAINFPTDYASEQVSVRAFYEDHDSNTVYSQAYTWNYIYNVEA